MTGARTRARRVAGSGNLARWITATWLVIVVLPAEMGLTFDYPRGAMTSFLQVVLVVHGMVLLARSPGWGLWIAQDEVIVRSWYLTRRFAVSDIGVCRVVPYSGLLNEWNHWELDLVKMASLAIDSRKRPVAFRATLAWRTRMVRQVAEFNRLLDEQRVAAGGVAETPLRPAGGARHAR